MHSRTVFTACWTILSPGLLCPWDVAVRQVWESQIRLDGCGRWLPRWIRKCISRIPIFQTLREGVPSHCVVARNLERLRMRRRQEPYRRSEMVHQCGEPHPFVPTCRLSYAAETGRRGDPALRPVRGLSGDVPLGRTSLPPQTPPPASGRFCSLSLRVLWNRPTPRWRVCWVFGLGPSSTVPCTPTGKGV